MNRESESSRTLALYQNFDCYVSEVVGSKVCTGFGVLELEALSEEFRRQVSIDLKEQKERFAEEDRKLADYIAKLPSKGKASMGKKVIEVEEDEDESDFDESLLDIDPVDYRKHDLYKILGLEKRRHLATPEEIKAAYRRRVVKHHPDKLKQNPRKRLNAVNPNLEDDSFFKLIQKAWQVLTDPGRKADYEACDPTFDDSIPEDREYSNVDEFCATYAPVFERNARFSKKQPVPSLGDASTPRASVDAFYSFWINVESWRRFEWQDEDEPVGNRDEKRWHEKKNKAKRDAKKKDDNTRLISLVETAMKRDPRMINWREADRIAKAAKKNSKVDAVKAAKEAEIAKKAAEAVEKAAKEAADKAIKESAAAVKATAKAALKGARKAFRDALGSPEIWALDLVAEIRSVQALGLIVERVLTAIGEDTQRLARVTESINCMVTNFNGERRGHLKALIEFMQSVETNSESEITINSNSSIKVETIKSDKVNVQEIVQEKVQEKVQEVLNWETEEIDILINAVKQFPGGSANRWDQITTSLNRQLSHQSNQRVFTVDQVIAQTALLQSNKDAPLLNSDERDEAQTLAALNSSKKKRDPRVDMAAPTIAAHYFETEVEIVPESTPVTITVTWSPEDQLALESALKSVPADDSDRWERVAQLVPGKSKKECLSRVKEIAAMLKAKK